MYSFFTHYASTGTLSPEFFLTESYYSHSALFQAITMDICYWVYNFMLEAPPIKICCINILSSDHNIIITFRDNEPHQGLLFSFSFMNKFGYCQELMKLKGKERRQHSDWLLRETLLRVTGWLLKEDHSYIFPAKYSTEP